MFVILFIKPFLSLPHILTHTFSLSLSLSPVLILTLIFLACPSFTHSNLLTPSLILCLICLFNSVYPLLLHSHSASFSFPSSHTHTVPPYLLSVTYSVTHPPSPFSLSPQAGSSGLTHCRSLRTWRTQTRRCTPPFAPATSTSPPHSSTRPSSCTRLRSTASTSLYR